MSSSAEINARLDAVEESAKGSLQKSYYGIAARLDRIPAGKAVRIVLWLAGGICFCDSIDMNIAGPIIAQFLTTGWSNVDANALFVSITALGYLFGGLISGVVSDGIGRKKATYLPSYLYHIGSCCLYGAEYGISYRNSILHGTWLGSNISMWLWCYE